MKGRQMSNHDCHFQISRLRCNYKGTDYDIKECEECGVLGLLAGQAQQRRLVDKKSAEFDQVIELIEFLIRAIRRGQSTD
jgi:hypothetical protein